MRIVEYFTQGYMGSGIVWFDCDGFFEFGLSFLKPALRMQSDA